MLNFDVKRKINSLRDILVGKVPDPKAQVEQITIALIYKFMDDMDLDAMEFGAEREFFKGDYKKYAWTELMSPQISGTERVFLYGEGIEKMQINPDIPSLFRDMFKGAFLPYRDPETLNMFLKEINEFKYDHSEDLGNAFEYLLSIMGSQGDAGQFRTPRHIIDMMVEIIEPNKRDSVLDPACGTAGFLISSYKHILKDNLDKDGNSTLTADDRNRLTANFTGYDISPDMVRLSRVNMYLHKFAQPKIYEYDTLTSLDKWDDQYDIILANPPFMTPKGGIIPHNRFRVQANRSEVLFVDYIAEHLNPNGRAAVIVPEGIVFQSANAYKDLRRYLVEDGLLYAVISLPAGIFNPYSGVKTSILLFDKAVAKLTDNILFVKLENDGFDLGAQRRVVKGSGIPDVIELVKKYKAVILSGSEESLKSEIENNPFATLAAKTQVAKQDYILVGERYKEAVVHNTVYPMVELGEICEFKYGKPLKQEDRKGGEYPVFGSNGIVGYHDEFLATAPFIVVGRKGSAGAMVFSNKNGTPIDTTFYIDEVKNGCADLKFLYFALQSLGLDKVNVQAGVPGLNRNDAYTKKIPLPPLVVQEQIVAEIEGYQKIIDGARQVVENYKPTIKIDPEWEMVELGEMFFKTTLGLVRSKGEQLINGNIKYIKMDCITINGELDLSKTVYIDATEEEIKRYSLDNLDFIYNTRNSPDLVGKSAVFIGSSQKYIINNNILKIKFKNELNPIYVNLYLNSPEGKVKVKRLVNGTTSVAAIYQKDFATITIPLPPIETQQKIVARINEEQKAVVECKKLIATFKQKINDKISEVWGK